MDNTARLWEAYPSVEAMREEAMRRLRFLITREECLEYFDAADCQDWGENSQQSKTNNQQLTINDQRI